VGSCVRSSTTGQSSRICSCKGRRLAMIEADVMLPSPSPKRSEHPHTQRHDDRAQAPIPRHIAALDAFAALLAPLRRVGVDPHVPSNRNEVPTTAPGRLTEESRGHSGVAAFSCSLFRSQAWPRLSSYSRTEGSMEWRQVCAKEDMVALPQLTRYPSAFHGIFSACATCSPRSAQRIGLMQTSSPHRHRHRTAFVFRSIEMQRCEAQNNEGPIEQDPA
jgi:hypothetical protein